MPRRNEEAAGLLENIAKLLSLLGESPYRIRAYTEAARAIAAMAPDIEEIHRAGRLEEIHGVGPSIAAKLAEHLDTGTSSYYDQLRGGAPMAAADLLEVSGIGPERATLLSKRGISSVLQLEQSAREHRLDAMPGFGEKLEEKLAREAARVAQRTKRMLLGKALPAAEDLVQRLRETRTVHAIEPAGSIRRMKETIGDIDILISADHPVEVMNAFATLPIVKEVLASGPTRGSVLTRDDLQIDIRVIGPDQYGSALQYFTGSKEHNIALRTLAHARGWKLSEYGLFDQRDRRIAGRTEEEVYCALGLDWIPPELRENRGEIEAAGRHQLPTLISLDDIRGDLHTHTTWSDGHDTPEAMVEAAIARGYRYLALTDHSRSLRVAHGLSVEQVREQRRLIDRLNERYAPFRVLHGSEVDILSSGELDYPDEVLAQLDIVGVSVHRAFGQPRERMTARIIRAMRNRYVDVLNHPTGRLLMRRSAYDVDVEAIMRAATEHGVALELDVQPDRLDLDDVWSRRARDAGVALVCDSDAHSTRHLDYMRYAVATARRGWVEPRDVLNTLPLDRLLAHLNRRATRARSA